MELADYAIPVASFIINLFITITTVIIGYIKRLAKIEERITVLEENYKDLCKKLVIINENIEKSNSSLDEVKNKITAIEVKTEVWWNWVQKEMIDILHHPNMKERDELLEKLKDETITQDEMLKLKDMLCDIVQNKEHSKTKRDELIAAILLVGRIEQLMIR